MTRCLKVILTGLVFLITIEITMEARCHDTSPPFTNATSIESDSLELILSHFKEPGQPIPRWLCIDFFEVGGYEEFYFEARATFSREFNGLHLLAFEMSCSAGGSCSVERVYTVNDQHEVLATMDIGKDSGNATIDRTTKNKFILDNLIELRLTETKYAFNKESGTEEFVSRKLNFEYYLIEKSGQFTKVKNVRQNTRKYPESAYRVLSLEELNLLPKVDLDIMRNEIFASYGYRFKTDKWQQYFDKQEWYQAQFDDVTARLSIIEKVNVSRILEVSRVKR